MIVINELVKTGLSLLFCDIIVSTDNGIENKAGSTGCKKPNALLKYFLQQKYHLPNQNFYQAL
jgi:hypothetical protein